MKKNLYYTLILLYLEKKVRFNYRKKKSKADTTLVVTNLNFFSDSTLADTLLANITHADILHFQIPY